MAINERADFEQGRVPLNCKYTSKCNMSYKLAQYNQPREPEIC